MYDPAVHRSVLALIGSALLTVGLLAQSVVTLVVLPPAGAMALVFAATGVWKPRLSWGVEVGALLAATVLVVMLVVGVAYLCPG